MGSPHSGPEPPLESVRTPGEASRVGCRPCPICWTTPLTPRQKVCSPTCRSRRWRQSRQSRTQELLTLLDEAEALHQRMAEVLQAIRTRLAHPS